MALAVAATAVAAWLTDCRPLFTLEVWTPANEDEPPVVIEALPVAALPLPLTLSLETLALRVWSVSGPWNVKAKLLFVL